VHVSLNRENDFYMLELQYDETFFNVRLNSLYADDLIFYVADSIESFLNLPKSDKFTLALYFLERLYNECEKYAERTLARIADTNVFQMVTLNYKYALLQNEEFVNDYLEDYLSAT